MWMTVFREALDSLSFYRRRTTITVISLGWGVASFVLLMAYGEGFDEALRSSFLGVGQDIVLMEEGQTGQQAGGLRAGRKIRLRRDDVEAIRQAVPSVAAISPEIFRGDSTVTRGSREKDYTVRAVLPEYERIRNMHIDTGRWIRQEDILQRNRVAVLGATVARELFGGIPPVGEEITVAGLRFTVVGVLEGKMQLSSYNRRDNQCIFLPYDTMAFFGDLRYPDYVVWSPVSAQVRDAAIREVRAELARIHRFSATDETAVAIVAFNQFLYIIDAMSLALRLLLSVVGALTLSIGGVGLANIMLASVTDRTREIGVLMAVGVRRRTILLQFLVEGLLIVTVGGVLGIVAGISSTAILGSMPLLGELYRDTADKGFLILHISPAAVLVPIGVLLAVGLLAGMVPAVRAARLNPIDALRYE